MVCQLEAEMPYSEFVEWMADCRVEPFGAPAEDYRAAIGAAANVNMNRGRNTKAVSPEDFIPWRDIPEPEQLTAEQSSAKILQLFGSLAKQNG